MNRAARRILFIEPPFYRLFSKDYSLDRYPLCLGYLAGAVKQATDWDVLVYNADFGPPSEPMKLRDVTTKGFGSYRQALDDRSARVWQEVASTITAFRPTVVGISIKAPVFRSARIVAEIAKEVDADVLVVAGGPHVTLAADSVLACPEIDVGVVGEGEQTIVELLAAVAADREFNEIEGLVYRRDGRIVRTAPRPLIENLDSLSFPAECAPEVLKDYERYPKSAFGFVVASRGCPNACVFCGSRYTWTQRVRHRSAPHVVREINSLRRAGVVSVHFDDDTFGVDKTRARDLCGELMTESPGVRWSCEVHTRVVDADTVSLMKRAGCRRIEMGVESGNDGILQAMRKGITLEEAFNAARLIKSFGLELDLFFMVGFPQETEATLRQTLEVMQTIPCDRLIYSIFTPYPGTEAFELCSEEGLIGADYDVSLYHHQSPANCFSRQLEPGDFRRFASEIEHTVDAKNARRRLYGLLSRATLERARERGLLRSIRRGAQSLADRDLWALNRRRQLPDHGVQKPPGPDEAGRRP